MDEPNRAPLKKIAVIGNYLPRRCGIATFTSDLCEAIAGEYEDTTCFAVPVNDREGGYPYPPRVRFELAEKEVASYHRAADFLNLTGVDLVCLQHEYGIFGGRAGSHILALMRELRMPVVTTLHTILREPDELQLKVMQEVGELSQRFISMSRRGVKYLQKVYKVPRDKIDFIPHGIPDVPFVDPSFHKDEFGVAGKSVLLTFGLLSPNKGIEYVIEALPKVVSRQPDVVYIVLGTTHPHVRQHEGESYRLHLEQLTQSLGLEKNVIFYNRFVSLDELVRYIGAADIYVTPYLTPAQIVSGTLAYAVGAGKAVISTPYWYAEELLADGRGRLVPFRDSEAVAQCVLELLDNPTQRHAMRKSAYLMGREMVWPAVARRYMESFERAREERSRRPPATLVAPRPEKRPRELPPLNLNHLRRMTDDTGLLQHATFTLPNYRDGYSIDDNARALMLAVLLEESAGGESDTVRELGARYMSFLSYALDPESNRFRNFMGFDRQWDEGVGAEDSHARALYALGLVLGRSSDQGLRGLAGILFPKALRPTLDFTSPRAWALTLMAVQEYFRGFFGDRAAQRTRQVLAEKLFQAFQNCSAPDWRWFEESLTYVNARLSHAMLTCGRWMMHEEMEQAGLKSLEWLARIQRAEAGHFVPIGCFGFYRRGGEKARFDQQPVEAYTMVAACLEAHRMTGKAVWYEEARRAFGWFLGRNDRRLPVYDPVSGGCRDGLQADGVNQNQGAESTLAFLLSLVEMQLAESEGVIGQANHEQQPTTKQT